MIVYSFLIPKSSHIQKSKNIVSYDWCNAYHKNSKDNIYYNKDIRYNLPFMLLLIFLPFFSPFVIAFVLVRILAYVCDIQGQFRIYSC